MKNISAFFGATILVANLVGTATVVKGEENGVISKEAMSAGNYCHLKFPAIEAKSLASDNPVPKDASLGDIIDYYGACDEKPAGQDQVERQRLDFNHHYTMNYSDRF